MPRPDPTLQQIADERFLIAAWKGGISFYAMAAALDIKHDAVRGRIAKLHKRGLIKYRYPSQCSMKERQQIVADRARNITLG